MRYAVCKVDGNGARSRHRTYGEAVRVCDELPCRGYVYDSAANITVYRNWEPLTKSTPPRWTFEFFHEAFGWLQHHETYATEHAATAKAQDSAYRTRVVEVRPIRPLPKRQEDDYRDCPRHAVRPA